MSGGKIVRIVGGKFTQECDTLTYYQDNFTINSGGKIRLTCDGEMIYGKPEVPPAGKYFIRGEWTSDWKGNNKITKAKLDDFVYFHVYTQGLEKGETVTFTLYDDDTECRWIWNLLNRECEDGRDEIPLLYPPVSDNPEEQTYIYYTTQAVDENGKVVLFIELTDSSFMRNLLNNEEDHAVELYFEFTCKEETVRLPEDTDDYLVVKYNPDNNIRIKPAIIHNAYNLPEILTRAGETLLFLASEAETGQFSHFLAVQLRITYHYRIVEEINTVKQKIYLDAIDMESRTAKRLGKYEVTRATNFIPKNSGEIVTTETHTLLKKKQVTDYFNIKDVKTGVLKTAKTVANVLDALDIIKLFRGESRDLSPVIGLFGAPYSALAFASWMIVRGQIEEMDEAIDDTTRVALENYKKKGLEGIKNFKETMGAKLLNFDLLENIYQPILDKVLNGEIKQFIHIRKEKETLENTHPKHELDKLQKYHLLFQYIKESHIYLLEIIILDE